MRWILTAVIVLFTYLPVNAAPTVKLGESVADTELGAVQDLARDRYNVDIKALIGDIISGNMGADGIADNAVSLFWGELKQNLSAVKKIIMLCVLNGIACAVYEGFGRGENYKLTCYASYAAAAGIIAAGFKGCCSLLTDGTESILEIIRAAAPFMLCVTAATSGGAAAVGYSGIIGLALGDVGTLIGRVIVPQITFSVLLGVFNCLWDKSTVGRLSKLMAFCVEWELKACALLFTGLLALARIGVVPASAAVGKGVKLAVGAVPVVGAAFQNSVEAVAGFAAVLKGGAAAAFVMLIVLAAFATFAKLAAVMLAYKLTAALTEPMGSKKITDMTDIAGDGIKLLVGAYFAVAVIFISAVVIMLGSLG